MFYDVGSGRIIMSNLKLDLDMVTTYQQVADFLGSNYEREWYGRERPRTSLPSMEIGHNTDLSDMSHGILEVSYHRNPIIHFTPDEISVTLAGWNTITTRDRIHKLTPLRVENRRGSKNRRERVWHIGGTPCTVSAWYSFPWPSLSTVADPEALLIWGRSVEAIER
jgi:hypothetical protein